ncbi:MAG TPA: hypothetical protein VGN51_20545 [Acidimicrobiia bacterium]
MTIAEQLGPVASPDALPVDPRPYDAAGAESAPTRSRRLTTLAVALLALSPFVVAAWSIIRTGFPAGALFGDRALIGISAIDAWRAPVLLGSYSRFYWHHPGPLYSYVLNAWSVVFGDGTVALVLGAVAINATAVVGILVLAYRRGGRPLLMWASVLLTAYLVAIDPVPFDIWNPSVTLVPFVVVLLLAWSVACRDWWAGPWLALVASFAVQTHVGLAPGVGVAVGFGVAVGVVRQRRAADPLADRTGRTIRRAAGASGAIAFVVWLPPLIEQFTTDDGNLSALVRFFSRPGSPHTISEGLTNTGLQATLMLRSLFEPISLREDFHQGLTVAVVVSAVALAAALVAARKVCATDVLVLLALVAVELVTGVYAITRIVDAIQFYLVQWISGVGFVLWLAIGGACIEFAHARWSGVDWWRRCAQAATVVMVAVLCVGALRAFPTDAGRMNRDLNVPDNRELFGYVPSAQLLAATRSNRTVVLRLDSLTAWEVMASDALLLVQHGRHVEVVETPVTRLLFDDALLVRSARRSQILAFRDRPDPHLRGRETLVADQGEWSIVNIEPGS